MEEFEDLEIVNPKELREEMLLQLLAVFIRRFGGEVTISTHEFGMVEGLEIVAKHTTPDNLVLRLEDEVEVILETDEGFD